MSRRAVARSIAPLARSASRRLERQPRGGAPGAGTTVRLTPPDRPSAASMSWCAVPSKARSGEVWGQASLLEPLRSR